MNRTLLMLLSAATMLGFAGIVRADVDFAKDVKPILETNCIRCHGPEKAKAKLHLDSREGFMKGSEDGPIFVAGNSAKSKIYQLINQPKSSDDRMPPEGEPLSKVQVETIKKWIDEGAKWPSGLVLKAHAAGTSTTATAPTVKDDPGVPITAAEKAAVAELNNAGVLAIRLAQNTNLLRVDFSLRGKQVKDDELAALKDIPNLVELNLGGTTVTDASLAKLKDAANLTRLGLQNTKITDAGLEHLKGLKKLTSLNVYGTAVTDKGLESLSGLKSLKHVYVWMTKVTPEGAKKFSTAIAGVDVNRGYEAPPPEKPKEAPKAAPKQEVKKADVKKTDKKPEKEPEKKK